MNARALIIVAIVGCNGSHAGPDAREIDAGTEPIPPAGIVAWFKLNNSLEDSTGNYYQMYTGGSFANFFGEGYHGAGAYMDGSSQYGLVDASPSANSTLDFQGAFTVATWVRPERTPTDFEVIASRSFGTGTESSFALAIDSTMRLRYDSQGGASLMGTTPLTLNQWAFVALTYDGMTKRTFINGMLDATGAAALPVTWDHEYLIVGADEGVSATKASHHLQGSVDNLMLFERALDASELAALAAP